MDTYWVPGVNKLENYGRWAFAEFTDTYLMQSEFAEKIEAEFNRVIETTLANKVHSVFQSLNEPEPDIQICS
ncbi:MAG: hypothetical protein V3V31_15475 [Methylococcales bacterium]